MISQEHESTIFLFSVCQYVASTRLKIFESADTNDNKGDIVNELMKYINSTQAPEEKKKKKNDQGRLANRRMTIKDLQDAHLDKKEKGDFINLEKQFKVRFQGNVLVFNP